MSGIADDSVILRRHYGPPPEVVFAAFTTARALEGWLSPSPAIKMRVAEFSFVPGGAYRFVYSQPDGTQGTVSGAFILIEAPHQLSFSWMWAEPDAHAGIDSHVLIEFRQESSGTELILTHTNLSAPQMAPRHGEGWRGALDRLTYWLSDQ